MENEQPRHGNGEPTKLPEHIVEIVSDSGEGAQKAGQAFAAISGKMGNGVWTVEIIPAEIKPPARSRAGASGIRVRVGGGKVSNMGDEADLVVAFNEQVLHGRITQKAFKPGTIIILENKWASDPAEAIRTNYAERLAELKERGYDVRETPIHATCKTLMRDPRLGKNMFVLGMLCRIYSRDLELAFKEVQLLFGRKGPAVVESNQNLISAGYEYATTAFSDLYYQIPSVGTPGDDLVMNGNQAIGLGTLAAGIDLVSMYPITPATSASHYLAAVIEKVGGVVHQAEDEIAAVGFAIGASYAGKTAITLTSGPGLALKTEFLGLAIMAEVPLVVVLVQRGGPSTGLPTKVEQGDLLATLWGAPGDAPKIVIAPATIEDCYHDVITARKLADAFRTPVFVLTDANLGTGVASFPRPKLSAEALAPPVDQSPWKEGLKAYQWDSKTGISPRPIPGQAGGEYTLTGLAHTEASKVAYDPESNQIGCEMRSKKLAALLTTLKPPTINGDDSGDLLVVGWGSTYGAIDEAIARARDEGLRVSAIHLRFLSPMEPGLKEIFAKFKQVMTIEINYSDPRSTVQRRHAQLALVLREHTLVDVDSWSNVHGQPLRPGQILTELRNRLQQPVAHTAQGESNDVRPQN